MEPARLGEKMLPNIRKITSKEEYQAVMDAAKMDNDIIDFPTHILYKDGEVVGGWSVDAIPLFSVWHHSKRITARDSLMLNNTIDTVMNERGHKNFLQLCNANSNYYSYMNKLGYKGWEGTTLFLKNVQGPSELLKDE